MTPDEARARAEIHFAKLQREGHYLEASGIGPVVRVCELTWRPPRLYNGPDLDDCWIAYVEEPFCGLHSSTILLIDDESGETVYFGSAHDEG